MSTNSNYAPHIFRLRALAELQIYFSFFRGVPLGAAGKPQQSSEGTAGKGKAQKRQIYLW